MSFFATVIICDLREVFFRAFRFCFVIDCIYTISRRISTGVPLFAFLFLKLFFGLFSSLLGYLRIIGGIIHRLGVLAFWLRFFNFRVFYCNALNLYLSCGDVSETIFLLSLIVYLSDIESKLEACFGLSLDRLLDYLFASI